VFHHFAVLHDGHEIADLRGDAQICVMNTMERPSR
jgi:hypothetical protein